MKSRDENDRLRDGTLPNDPFADAKPARSPGAAGPRWRTYGEVLAAGEEKPREWLIPDLLPFAALVLLVGHAKRAGKSTFAWGLVSAAANGGLFLGRQVPRTKAIGASGKRVRGWPGTSRRVR